jgi:hypothetical protein
MRQFPISRLQENIRASVELRREYADFTRRALADFAETRAATLKAIAESRELLAKIDVIMARILAF